MGAHELAVAGFVGSGIGAALGTPLLWAGRASRADTRVLGATLLTVAALASLISARLAGWLPGSTPVGHAVNTLGLLAFPLAVAYVRVATASPRAFHAVLLAPLPAYAAAAVLRMWVTGRSEVPFSWLLPVAVGFTAVAAMAAWRGRHIDGAPVPPTWIAGFMALVNVAQVARMDLGHLPPVRAAVPLVMLIGFLALACYLAWRHAAATVVTAAPSPALAPAAAPAATPVVVSRYARSTLDDAAGAALLARVVQALDHERLFAQPDLTLATLARAALSTPHLVSEALNRYGHTTFRELVSRRRVSDIQAQLADPASDGYTIEGMGLAAGFRSRSAMYDAFRRVTGTTPARPVR